MLLRATRRTPFNNVFITNLIWRRVAPITSVRMASTLPKLPVFEAIAGHDPQSTAVIHCTSGRRFTYDSLLKDVADAKDRLRESAGSREVAGERVAFLVENGYDYVGATLT